MENAVVVSSVKRKAKADYECYGCAGECPISAGDGYMDVAVRKNGGIEHLKYCQRCNYAIISRIIHSKTHSVDGIEKGAFRWSRLSSGFKKTWSEMCHALAELRKRGEDERETLWHYLKRLGVDEYNELQRRHNMEKAGAETGGGKATRGKTHPNTKKLRALEKRVRTAVKGMERNLDDMLVAHLTAKKQFLAKGMDAKAICDAVEAFKEIRKRLAELKGE